jgi:hypothetical protein
MYAIASKIESIKNPQAKKPINNEEHQRESFDQN